MTRVGGVSELMGARWSVETIGREDKKEGRAEGPAEPLNVAVR